MARTQSTFCCPNCFSQFQKDDSILMLSSGAAVSGEGIGWSGKLDRDIDRIKRVKYCKRCRQSLDFHALLQGKLVYHAWGPSWRRWHFCSCSPRSGHSFWASLGLALLAVTGSWLERKRLARWRLNERELAKLTVP